jgi:hypothetical protein
LYAPESTVSVHAGLEAWRDYLTLEAGRSGVRPLESASIDEVRPAVGAIYVGALAVRVFDAFGVGQRELDELEPELIAALQATRDPISGPGVNRSSAAPRHVENRCESMRQVER